MVLLGQNGSHLYICAENTFMRVNLKKESVEKILLPEATTNSTQKQAISKNTTISTITFSKCGKLVAISTENKQVIVYNSDLDVIRNFEVNRATSKLAFTPGNDVVVADKTGDVYLYYLNGDENEKNLILGHLSVILDIKVSECGNYIITCDRDEKIRVSQFPNAYNIVSYCLGHKEFVTNVEIFGKSLISASGDGTLRIWDFVNGIQVGSVNTNDYLGDKGSFEEFCAQMDAEKVEVNALPITDMQIFNDSNVFCCVSLLNFHGVQLYKIVDNVKLVHLRNIGFDSNVTAFSFSRDLIVLTETEVFMYNFVNCDYVKCKSDFLSKLHDKYSSLFKGLPKTYEIEMLYKRKFDNVQEYLERKKLRLK